MIKARIIALLVCASFCLSCPSYRYGAMDLISENRSKIYKKSFCEPSKPFPQMILIPFFKETFQIVPDCKVYPKNQTSLAMLVFYHHWTEYFGDDDFIVKNSLEKLMITWGLSKKRSRNAYNLDGDLIEHATVIGLTTSKTTIWVWRGYDFKISESSFIHELVHVALRNMNGHGDRDHEGAKYSGWTSAHTKLVSEAKETLRTFGI